MLRLIGLSLLFPLLFAETAPQPEEQGDLPRFSILMMDGVYRGGQPTRQGFEFLKEKGVKTIINLRAENNSESRLVQELGMNYIQIPVDEARPWSVIPPAALAKFFELVNDPTNYPIFFHCLRGADRTGAFAAFYRIAIDHWDPTEAYTEARDVGMRWYYVALRAQIERFNPPSDPAKLQTAMESRR
ncbi:MAG TPA: tyrosine-protein phosphatase [Terriglobia bacterium]|nr:tyrosine-protein phosphatase [Terriglobia bacterium]